MAENIDFDPVDSIAVGTVGPAGQRQFFLRATAGTGSVVLHCEKFHVQGLVARIREIMTSQGKEVPDEPGPRPPAPAAHDDPAWTIGELGLGFHEARSRFVIVAREAGSEEETEDRATARFWISESQVNAFVAQANAVLAGGRPACPYCGLPMDPAGHPCPASNGSRPIF